MKLLYLYFIIIYMILELDFKILYLNQCERNKVLHNFIFNCIAHAKSYSS